MNERAVVWVVIVLVVAAGAGVLGYVAGTQTKSSPTPAQVTNSTLSILGAGTLAVPFSQLANLLVNETPGISAPAAAQTYEGSLDITTAMTTLHQTADVAAVADFRLIPQLLQPTYASYEIVWGLTSEVLAFNANLHTPTGPAFAGINATNWPQKLLACTMTCAAPGTTTYTGVPLGVWNQSSDPNGYNEIFSLELQGLLMNTSHDSNTYLNQFYSGGAGGFNIPNPTLTRVEHESQAATLVSTGTVCAVITYHSFAVANSMSYVSFNTTVGLNDTSAYGLSQYAPLTTQIIGSSGSLTSVKAAPVLFGITVPLNAQNPELGAAFVHLLLSPLGASLIAKGGAFQPIFPGWSNAPGAVPPVLAPDVVSMPSWASAYLAPT